MRNLYERFNDALPTLMKMMEQLEKERQRGRESNIMTFLKKFKTLLLDKHKVNN